MKITSFAHRWLPARVGPLIKAMAYLEKQWGSVEKAYAIGVKLVLVPA